MPTIDFPTMPEMPTISSPTMGGSFYRPSMPQQLKQSSTAEETKSSNSAASSVLSDATTTEDLLLSLLGSSTNLSAQDVSTLYDYGMFDSISSLTGGTSSLTSGNLSTTLLLRQILQELDELKTEQKTASAVEQDAYTNKKIDSETFKTRDPSILRFKINGYSIKDSITDTFISVPEPDGSFLLTADRKYFVNKKSITETFYMLFTAIKSNGATTTFSVTSSIAQSEENKNSYVYKLCQEKGLTAEKTGNLVVLHYNGSDVSADLLMDIDK